MKYIQSYPIVSLARFHNLMNSALEASLIRISLLGKNLKIFNLTRVFLSLDRKRDSLVNTFKP